MEEVNGAVAEKQPLVRKATGEKEPFNAAKLEKSLFNAGANDRTVKEITEEISEWIFDGVTTKKIYARAFALLRSKKSSAAPRYRLKQAILEMGPSGYPFEHLVGEIFKKRGYKVEVGANADGDCVTHEMDVIATKENRQHLIECKFGQDQGKYVSVQVPLYVRSRVDDIVSKRKNMPEYEGTEFTGWVVSSTRFSHDAVTYGTCAGLKMLGWDYPAGEGLKDIIEKENIIPVTLLSKLNKEEKRIIMEKGIVTCRALLNETDILDTFEISQRKKEHIIKEARKLTGGL